MSVTVIIPARWESSRFPGKPLTLIKGAGSTEESEPKTLIRRTWDVAIASGVGPVVVATDDIRIADHVASFGGRAMLTSRDCNNGTERVAQAAEALGLRDRDGVINLQGDALLTPPEWLVVLANWVKHPTFTGITTIAAEVPREPHPGDVSVALKLDGTALYFSRSRLPSAGKWLLHFGIYGYTAAMLQWYRRKGVAPGPLEMAEGLEQLRFLEYGTDVRPIIAPAGRLPRCEINYPGDVPWAEEELRQWGIE